MNRGLRQLDAFLKKNKISRRARDAALRSIVPEYFIDQKLRAFEQSNNEERAYCDLVENYLQRERENRIDQINEALLKNVKTDFEHENLSRIVRAQFHKDPLCCYGSVRKPPGGRFNFGQTTRGASNYFQALYLANEYNTAFQESYHSEDESIGNFAHFNVQAKIDRYIDLRSGNAINDFFDVIQSITIPETFIELAKQINIEPMSLTKNGKELYASIFSERYKAWDTWVDQYSSSQWFGYYVYNLGIPAIVYPSVRNKEGFNLAVFTEHFKDTDNRIELKSPSDWENVPEERKFIDGENYCHIQKPIIKK